MDIKTLWNKFKRDIKKEGIDLAGCCYMNCKQIKNHTATILLCTDEPYEELIKYYSERDTNDDWYKNKIKYYTELLNKYGTRENEYKDTYNRIINSKAFNNFVKASGLNIKTCIEYTNEMYYLRINY